MEVNIPLVLKAILEDYALLPVEAPSEERRVYNDAGFSIIAPPNWTEWINGEPPMIQLTPKQVIAARSKAGMGIALLIDEPSDLAQCDDTEFLGQPAHQKVERRRSTFDDPALTTWTIYVQHDENWFAVSYFIAEAHDEIPDMARRYLESVEFTDHGRTPMAETIITFDDYVSQLTNKLRSLRHFERCLFSAWCAEHLLTTHAELVEQSLSESALQVLRNVLDEIQDVLLTGSIPDTMLLNSLDGEFMEVGPDDPEAAMEIPPVVTNVQCCIGLCILGCRRNDVGVAQKTAEVIINVIDFQLDERNPDYVNDSLREMFRYPEMRQELEVQLAMIKHLGGQYTLDHNLRTIFRE